MTSLKRAIGRKAVKSTAKHSARGAASKAKRKPLRSVTLVGIGCAIGGLIGTAIGRRRSPAPSHG